MMASDLFQETVSALSGNKIRSGLTMLGVVIGIGSVIAMVSIGQGAQDSIESNIQSLGSNLLTVSPGFSQGGNNRGAVSAGRGSAQSLKSDDAEALRALAGLAAVSPEISTRGQISAPTGNNTNATVMGVTPDYLVARSVQMANGSFVSATHLQSLGKVAALGPTVAADLFGEEDPVGKTIKIRSVSYKVIGVLAAKGGNGFSSPDNMIFLPLTTVQKFMTGSDALSSIAISVAEKERMAELKVEATALLAERHKVDPASPDFSILSQEDILGALSSITATFTAFLAAVAGISLLVGGIGIMNMMLTTVTERTREIGLRKAIGARSSDISLQFLSESVLLTFLGGAVGVALGGLAAIGISTFAGITTSVSGAAVLMAFGVSAAIGIVFGWYPARRAAGLNPIQALRYE